MDKREEERPPFNERAALEELERFKADIERYRQQRKTVGEEFDHFVKSFKTPQPPATPPPAVPAPPPRSAAPPAPPMPPPGPREGIPRAAEPAATAPPPAAERPVESPRHAVSGFDPSRMPPMPPTPLSAQAPPRVTPMPAKKGGAPVIILAVLMLAAGLAAWFFWPLAVDDSPPATTTAPAPAPATSAEPSPPAQPPAAAVPAPAPSNETVLVTLRPVWLRVIVDGVKIEEDEFPAGHRIPIKAGKTLVIRTGNAGAVSLTLNGKDVGPLGAEGQVVTRTYTVGGN